MLPLQKSPPETMDFEIIKNKLMFLQNREGKESFQKQIMILKQYIESDESQAESRSIQCGIAFHNQCICVSIGNLKNTLGKCKSTVNNCLQQMGYKSIQSKSSANVILYEAIPSLKTSGNARKWSVRTKSVPSITNKFSIEISKPLIIPSSKSNECLSLKTNFNIQTPQLVQTPIETEINYENNDFFINSLPNDFMNYDTLNTKFENFDQSEFPSLFNDISSYF